LEFVILEAEEEPTYEIAWIGEFLHIVGSPNLHNLFVLFEPVLICPLR
jgi:hypothetical protein